MRSIKLFVLLVLATFLLAACSQQSAPMLSQADTEATVNVAVQQTQTVVALSATPTVPPPTATAVPTETPEEVTPTSEPTSEAPAASAPPPASGDWSVYQGSDGAFEISLPSDWSYIDLAKGELGDQFAELLAKNPQMREVYSEEAIETMVKSGIKFFALQATADSLSSAVPTSLNIISTDIGMEISLDEFSKLNINQLTQVYGDIKVSSQTVDLGAAKAIEIRYQAPVQMADGTTHETALVQYLILEGTNEYVITFASTAENIEAIYETIFNIAKSFKLTP